MIAFILLIIGGLNWGLELFGWGIGGWGLPGIIISIIYALVAVSAIYEIFTHKSRCKACESKSAAPQM